MSNSSESFDPAELQLEQELRQMFEIDSQKDVETYLTCVRELQANTWNNDIQTMYRAIHTIKGGSVTVKADALLKVSTALEDMLSDLRYLDSFPSLNSALLQEMLEESGEIIASVLGSNNYNQEITVVDTKIARIKDLKAQIQQNYLAGWDEETQIQSEFAEQGLELVTLDLEIAISGLPAEGVVPHQVIKIAQELLEELVQIGLDLNLASGWTNLLSEIALLLETTDNGLWKVKWSEYFVALKNCAKQGGNYLAETADSLEQGSILEQLDFLDDDAISDRGVDIDIAETAESLEQGSILEQLDFLDDDAISDRGVDIDIAETAESLEQGSILEQLDFLDDDNSDRDVEVDIAETTESLEQGSILEQLDFLDDDNSDRDVEVDIAETTESLEQGSILEQLDFLDDDELDIKLENNDSTVRTVESKKTVQPSKSQPKVTEDIQVPIALSKLDRSARSIVDTLMIARTMESFYQDLHQDLQKLIVLAKDSVQHLAQLRQIQNDYTSLSDLDLKLLQKEDSPNLERYRAGYVTINRLLENNLRLSEIGTEAELTARETSTKLQQLNKSITQLKDIVEDSRLVPFRNLSFRVKAIVRDLITRYGKSANLEIKGEQIELDVGTTRRLEPILLHLVRNAYDHGLESAEQRLKQGKPEKGNLSLTLQRYGSTYSLKLQDDGGGIDAKAVRAKAEKLNLPLTRTDTPSELLAVICQPGFSSSDRVSEVSGRGVGMDVVAQQIMLLDGSLSLETTQGKGTTFTINFPVPHLLVSCLLVRASDRIFAIPTEQIISTSLWNSLSATKIDNSDYLYNWEIEYESEITPALDLLDYWYPQPQERNLEDNAIGIRVKSQPDSSSFWLLADKMLGKLELKIQPFPSPIVPPQGIMGVSLQPDSSLIPVIEVNSLQERIQIKLSGCPITIDSSSNAESEIEKSQTILIVDDAALMRRRIEASLTAYGFVTHTCADGLEAWNWLQTNPNPMLVITDVEMPNMDGFTLIDRCRQEDLNFPIMVVSSRLAEEWDKEARRLGATDYLTKGFSTGELVGKVKSLVEVD